MILDVSTTADTISQLKFKCVVFSVDSYLERVFFAIFNWCLVVRKDLIKLC